MRDQGIGISPKDQEALFNTYMQINANGNQGGKGTGVGLAICKGTEEDCVWMYCQLLNFYHSFMITYLYLSLYCNIHHHLS